MWLGQSLAGLVVILGLIGFAVQTMLIVAAERGRKRDLRRHRAQSRHEFNLTVLIPYNQPKQLSDLHHLLRALDSQQYSRSRLRVMLGYTPDTQDDIDEGRLDNYPIETLFYNGEQLPNEHVLRGWLVERALASGHHDLLIMLQPGDAVKPDFCSQVATMTYQAEVMQGYVTTRDVNSPLEKQQALTKRLFNRIELAGRYHLGMTGRLQASGWAIHPNVLERIPHGNSTPTEYSLKLLMGGYRVNWAPSITVFHRLGLGQPLRLFDVVEQSILAALDRCRLIWTLTSPMVMEGLARPQVTLLLEWLSLFRIPALMVGFVLAAFALGDSLAGNRFAPVWQAFVVGMVAIHVLALWVARCNIGNIIHSLLWTPTLAAAGLCLMPLMMVNLLVRQGIQLARSRQQEQQPLFVHQQSNRLNDAIPAVTNIVDEPASGKQGQAVVDFIKGVESVEGQEPPETHSPGTDGLLRQLEAELPMDGDAPRATTDVLEKIVPISNGKQQVDAVLQVHTSYQRSKGDKPQYRMTLAYRSVSFSTQRYRILDQAFYELESKVMSKGLTIVTCGSCGYFYHPTADVADRIQSNGVCLFGKQGREVDLATDAVTVISEACHYHAPLNEREGIVRDWQDSLAMVKQRVI